MPLIEFVPRQAPKPVPVVAKPGTPTNCFFANGSRCLKIYDAAGNCLSIPEDGNCTHIFPVGVPESEQDYSHDVWLKTPEQLLFNLARFLGYEVRQAPRPLIDLGIINRQN
jgi:hypothetical protein